MTLRPRIEEHAPALRRLIGCAAPLIEQRLLASGDVHSAWFVLSDDARWLMLAIHRDGRGEPLSGLLSGLLAALDAHLVDTTIQPPIGGVFFSASPRLTVADQAAADAWCRHQQGLGPRQRPMGTRPDAREPVDRAAHDALLVASMGELFEPHALARQAGLRLALALQPADRVRDALSDQPLALREEVRSLVEVLADHPIDDPTDPAELRRRVIELVDVLPAQVEARLAATQGGRGRSRTPDSGPALTRPEAQALADRLVGQIARWPGLGPTDPAGARLRLRHAPGLQRVHGPLCVVLDIRSPQPEHARALAREIRLVAPALERCLRQTGLAHVAWFVLPDGDRRLALLAQVDGETDDFLGLLARVAGELFDRLFAHLADPPPLPVRHHPREFVDRLRRARQGHDPVAGYFFSANPGLRVSDIQRAERAWRGRST
jgi:hypothetical protein